jgi:UDP-glucose 4-epimerase
MNYKGKRAVVTGGLGFIGSNLAIRLADLGARVSIVDPCVQGCGGNAHNICPVADRVEVIPADISDAGDFGELIRSSDIIFNLAGEISHIHSMQFPERDLLVNALAQMRFLQVCAREAPGIRIVYAGTRQVYGVPQYLPVDEAHPIAPVDFNGVHKYAATMYHSMLSRAGLLDGIVLRLSNVYGPRMALGVPCQGFLSTFVRRVVLGEPIDVFGDGSQLRDAVYVDDVVEAFLLAGDSTASSRSYNVGGSEILSLREIAETASRLGGGTSVRYKPFPEDRKQIDIGSYYTDSRRINGDLGWTPRVSFEEGLRRTVAFYEDSLEYYLGRDGCGATCNLPEHNGIPHRLVYASK